MAQNLARLGVVLGIDTAQFTTGLQKAKKSLSEIGDFALKAGAVAGAAFAALTYKAMQFSDEMSDLADATGVSISKVLQLSDATQRAGGNFEGGSKAITKFIQNIDAAASGSDEMQKSFAKAGVSLDDLANLTVEQLLNKTSQGIANIGDKATQTGAKMDLFGKSMRTVDMETFNTYIQKNTKEFESYESAIKAAADLTDKFERASNKLGLTFIKNVMPPLTKFFELINSDGGVAEKIFNGIGTAIYGATLTLQSMQSASEQIAIIWSYIKKDISFDEMNRQMMNSENNYKLAIYRLQEYRREVEKGKGGKSDKDDPFAPRKIEQGAEAKKAAEAAKKEAEKQEEMLKVAKLISDEYNRQQVYSVQQLAIRNLMLGLTQDERRIQEAINQVTGETSRKIDEITRKREDAAGRGAGPNVIAEYDRQIAKVFELEQIYIEMAKNVETASIASQRTFTYGWDVALNQFAENAYNYATIAQEVFTTLTSSMTTAINTFVQTGKFSFQDFATSVIKDLIAIQLRMQMMQLFSSIAKGFGGFSFGTPGPELLAGFANGGNPPVGVPSIVGERGPELFVPSRPGTIVPNHQLSNMGSTTNITNNYIDAIDTKSFEDRLYGSSKAVWAANQYGNKNISTSRMRT
jgi:lambda family phage tail tape measure protein